MIQGTIIRVAGPVVDVQFAAGRLPALQEALTVTAEGTERTMEVAQHVNESTVRCIMLSASEGLGKGMVVTATGHGLTAPVGEATLGRMFDPLGRPIDGKGSVDEVPHWPIHRKAPSFAEQKPATEILETGIKVIDLLAPYAKGGHRARRLLHLHRRRRALPRGLRPLGRDERLRRPQQDCTGLRPDERASRSTYARG